MWRRKKNIQLVDSRLYKYWQALYLSYYSPKFYIDVAKRWRGFGIGYFLFFFLIAAVPFSIKSIIDMNHYIKHDLLDPVEQIPEFKLVEGKVIFDKPMPYFIKNPEGNDVIIIDTTGKIKTMSKEYPELLMLINKRQIIFRMPKLKFLKNDLKNSKIYDSQEVTTHELSEINDDTFDGKAWLQESKFIKMKNRILLFVYPIVVSALFGIFTTVILAFSILGQVAAYAIFKHRLKFKQASRLSVIASSIGIWLYLCLKTFGISSSRLNLGCMVIVFVYFSYAVLVVKRSSKSLVHY